MVYITWGIGSFASWFMISHDFTCIWLYSWLAHLQMSNVLDILYVVKILCHRDPKVINRSTTPDAIFMTVDSRCVISIFSKADTCSLGIHFVLLPLGNVTWRVWWFNNDVCCDWLPVKWIERALSIVPMPTLKLIGLNNYSKCRKKWMFLTSFGVLWPPFTQIVVIMNL